MVKWSSRYWGEFCEPLGLCACRITHKYWLAIGSTEKCLRRWCTWSYSRVCMFGEAVSDRKPSLSAPAGSLRPDERWIIGISLFSFRRNRGADERFEILCLLNASGQGHAHAHTARDTWHQPYLCTYSILCIWCGCLLVIVGLGQSGRSTQTIQLPKANDRLNRKVNMSTRSVFLRVSGVGG